MQDELNEFERHRVWTLVHRPQGKPLLVLAGCLETIWMKMELLLGTRQDLWLKDFFSWKVCIMMKPLPMLLDLKQYECSLPMLHSITLKSIKWK